MSEYALPCVVCGQTLRNVFPGHVDNQPNDGVACTTHGNYGSTVFDSFDGEMLEFNVCDPCLVKAGEQGRVLSGYLKRPVLCEDVVIGYEDVDYRPVPWHQGLPGGRNEAVQLGLEDLESLPSTVHVTTDLDAVRRLLTT